MVGKVDTQLIARAARRATESPTGVGAAFDHNVTLPDLDGIGWQMAISDGTEGGEIHVQIAGSELITAYEIPVVALLRVVERRAGRFARETRVTDMLAAAPVRLTSDDFRHADFEPQLN